MDDIEDLNVTPSTRDNNKKANNKVMPTKLTKKTEKLRENIEISEKQEIPGTQTVYMKTYGCSHNSSDSEYMAGLLVEYGYKVTDEWDNADVYLINSCTVKNPSETTFMQLVKKAQNTTRPVIGKKKTKNFLFKRRIINKKKKSFLKFTTQKCLFFIISFWLRSSGFSKR